MASSAAENYLRQIYLVQERSGAELVGMGELAETMGVVPGTATAMVKKLAGSRLVTYEPYAGVRLTAAGHRLAIALIRRHRLIESFLVDRLGLDWSEIHAEAERLEHAMSDRVLEAIDALLGHPSIDPHGDPIPDPSGRIRETPTRRLADCGQGEEVRVVRVLDQEPDFLRFIDRTGLRPGVRLGVEHRDPAGDTIAVRAAAGAVTLGTQAAAKLAVEPVPR